jgi:glycosyltransferase involved in cell wall biosynthesis
MRVALAHFRVGETDGVSLEMNKWAAVLGKMGHDAVFITGSNGNTARRTFIIDELYYKSEKNAALKSAFYSDLGGRSEESLKMEILREAETIKEKLTDIIEKQKIDVLVPNNIFSLGHSIAAAIGFMSAIETTGIRVVCHHHDFWWEPARTYYHNQTTLWGREVMKNFFVPRLYNSRFRHCVINSPAQQELKKRCGIDSVVVPNVFDFSSPPWRKDDYNSTFRRDLGVSGNDILLLQATRVTNRKAIELAVDVVALLNTEKYLNKLKTGRRRFVLAVVGLHEGVNGYEQTLFEHIKNRGANVIVNENIVEDSRRIQNGRKIYSLWDAYVNCDIVTYPSIYEGWGNQFLESVFAKIPMIMYEYDVYKADIGPKGFEIISLGDRYGLRENGLVCVETGKIESVCEKVVDIINDREAAQQKVLKNFELGREHFSFEKLEEILTGLFNQ